MSKSDITTIPKDHLYNEIANEADKEQEIQKKHKLNNVPQLVQFLNLIYLPDDSNNNITYERQFLSMKDILSKVWECLDLFDDASSSFNKPDIDGISMVQVVMTSKNIERIF
ncbi:hypothetical protein RMCBS344292_15161 [Rhizopus microsporus]|nr:hypothetical protein RMCBS344292_09489 [Rhizopus microsporus]CEJ01125.1 hypothetical protein RMCBS344292_15161 [Rhizopus microsporus]